MAGRGGTLLRHQPHKNFSTTPISFHCFTLWTNVCTFFCHTRQSKKNNKIKASSSEPSASLSGWCYVHCTDERVMCASRAICLTEQWLCGRSSWLCTNRLDVFSITRWPWSTTTGKAFNTNKFVDFFRTWLKQPRNHFLFGNSLSNSHTVYCFPIWSTLIECSSSMENSILFTNNNNPTSQLCHHKERVAQVWWLNLFIELATVSIIHVQKEIVNIKITTRKLWRESYWPLFCGHSVQLTCWSLHGCVMHLASK